MGTFTKREVVVFPFPFTDMTNKKLRPCLVLSEEMGEDILLCQISSQRSKKDKFCISLNDNDVQKGKLHTKSYIRCNMLFTASKSQIQRKICELKPQKYMEVTKKIVNIIK